MSPEQLSGVSRAGGRAAHKAGTAHRWTKAEAAEAGRKGGLRAKGVALDPGRSYASVLPHEVAGMKRAGWKVTKLP